MIKLFLEFQASNIGYEYYKLMNLFRPSTPMNLVMSYLNQFGLMN